MAGASKPYIALAVGLALAACSGPDYTRDGATDDQRRQDEALCRSQIQDLVAKERGIVADREATIGATDQRLGRTQLPSQMAGRDDSNRSGRLMSSCMSQRGYTTKKTPGITF
ncbi:MAG TPA: hypothetical protein VJR58_03400 [Vineibacter sp.]|nr:hypothetical protein [Vineibacter sp.]